MKTKKIAALALSATLMMGVMTGCGGTDEAKDESGSGLSGTVVVAGSTSVQPLSEELAEVFMEQEPGVTIQIQGGGSGVGIKSAKDGVADIGTSSRELKEEEKAGLTESIIAKDGIAVIANEQAGVDNLTMDQIQKIFTGEIKNWKDVGGPDEEIIVVSREAGSGTRGAFTEITKVAGKDAAGNDMDNTTENALVQPSTGAVRQTVANTPFAIGYCSIGALDDSVETLKVDGVEATEEGVKDGSYGISRPFIYITNGAESDAAKAFIDFIISEEGQKIVAEEFIPIN